MSYWKVLLEKWKADCSGSGWNNTEFCEADQRKNMCGTGDGCKAGGAYRCGNGKTLCRTP